MATKTARLTRFPEIDVHGTPRELGRQIGEACREQVRTFIAVVVERFNTGRKTRLDPAVALDVARGCVPYVDRYAPHLLEEARGVAEGAGVTLEAVVLLNVRNQLGAAAPKAPKSREGCTSIVVEAKASAQGIGIAGQNWDNDPATDPFSIVLTRRPAGKPALMCFTRPGEIGYMGLNSAGIGILMNAMPGRARMLGVPWYFLVRSIYEQTGLDGAVEAVSKAERAIPANAAMITPQGAADLEVMVDAVRVLRADEQGLLVHTNHCVHPDLLGVNEEFKQGIYGQSFERRERAGDLLRGSSRVRVADVKQALSDHRGYPTSICRHPNDDPATGWQRSVVSMIVEPAAGRMHLSRGNPCESPYEVYEL